MNGSVESSREIRNNGTCEGSNASCDDNAWTVVGGRGSARGKIHRGVLLYSSKTIKEEQ